MEADLTIGEARRLLSRVGFLETLPAGELEDLARLSAFSRLPAGGAFVVGPEEHAERMLLVLAGQVQVHEADPTDRELTLSVLEGGSFVGATGLVDRRARELRVRALEPSLLCRLGRGDLEALVLGRPEAGLRLVGSLAARLVRMEGRWADLAAKEVTARLAGVLLMLVEGEGIMTPEGPMIPTRYTHQPARLHDRGQQGGHDQGVRGAAGDRWRAPEEPLRPRHGPGGPQARLRVVPPAPARFRELTRRSS